MYMYNVYDMYCVVYVLYLYISTDSYISKNSVLRVLTYEKLLTQYHIWYKKINWTLYSCRGCGTYWQRGGGTIKHMWQSDSDESIHYTQSQAMGTSMQGAIKYFQDLNCAEAEIYFLSS